MTDQLSELYLEVLPKNLYKSQRAEVMVYKHSIRGFLYRALDLGYTDICRLEQTIYGGNVNHTTIMNSIVQFNNRSNEYLYSRVHKYIESRIPTQDSGITA